MQHATLVMSLATLKTPFALAAPYVDHRQVHLLRALCTATTKWFATSATHVSSNGTHGLVPNLSWCEWHAPKHVKLLLNELVRCKPLYLLLQD
jgi:hypothetical protein